MRRVEMRNRITKMVLVEFEDVSPVDRLTELMVVLVTGLKAYGISDDDARASFDNVLMTANETMDEALDCIMVASEVAQS
jgi:hypothetical protein